jgi:hypothetical protein
MSVCYCGEYGGGAHTLSARCEKPLSNEEREKGYLKEWLTPGPPGTIKISLRAAEQALDSRDCSAAQRDSNS